MSVLRIFLEENEMVILIYICDVCYYIMTYITYKITADRRTLRVRNGGSCQCFIFLQTSVICEQGKHISSIQFRMASWCDWNVNQDGTAWHILWFTIMACSSFMKAMHVNVWGRWTVPIRTCVTLLMETCSQCLARAGQATKQDSWKHMFVSLQVAQQHKPALQSNLPHMLLGREFMQAPWAWPNYG